MYKSYPQAQIRLVEITIEELLSKFKKPRRNVIISRAFEANYKRIIGLTYADVEEVYSKLKMIGRRGVVTHKCWVKCMYHCFACSDRQCEGRICEEK